MGRCSSGGRERRGGVDRDMGSCLARESRPAGSSKDRRSSPIPAVAVGSGLIRSAGSSAARTRCFEEPGVLDDVTGDGRPEVLTPVRFAAPRMHATESDAVFAFGADGSDRLVRAAGFDHDLRRGDFQRSLVCLRRRDRRDRRRSTRVDCLFPPHLVASLRPGGGPGWRHHCSVRATRANLLADVLGNPDGTTPDGRGRVERGGPGIGGADESGSRLPRGGEARAGPRLECLNCPQSDPAAMVLLPNSDVTIALARPSGWVMRARLKESSVELSVNDGFRQREPVQHDRRPARDQRGEIGSGTGRFTGHWKRRAELPTARKSARTMLARSRFSSGRPPAGGPPHSSRFVPCRSRPA